GLVQALRKSRPCARVPLRALDGERGQHSVDDLVEGDCLGARDLCALRGHDRLPPDPAPVPDRCRRNASGPTSPLRSSSTSGSAPLSRSSPAASPPFTIAPSSGTLGPTTLR